MAWWWPACRVETCSPMEQPYTIKVVVLDVPIFHLIVQIIRPNCSPLLPPKPTGPLPWSELELYLKLFISIFTHHISWNSAVSRYSDSLHAGRSWVRMPLGTRSSTPVQTGPWAPYNGYLVFPADKAAGSWRWPPTPSSTGAKERV